METQLKEIWDEIHRIKGNLWDDLQTQVHDLEKDHLQLRGEFTQMAEAMVDVRKILADIRLGLLGDPADTAKPGIIIRLDRIEQNNATRSKIVWFLSGGFLSLAPILIEKLL